MKRRCAWCGMDLGSKEPLGDGDITHGVCLPCSEQIIRAAGREVGASTSPPCQGSPESDAPALVTLAIAPAASAPPVTKSIGGSRMDRIIAEWTRFLDALPPAGCLRRAILDSWGRSRAAGVDPEPPRFQPSRVGDDDLQRRLKVDADLLAVAKPQLTWASTALSQVPHVVYLTDRDGIVLHSTGTSPQLRDLGLLPGYDSSERAVGTNGIGIALADNQPVAVVGPEHFSRWLHDCTCAAAPLHAADGTLIGAVALRTSLADGNSERVVLAASVARQIEQELTCRQAIRRIESHESLLAEADRRKDEFLAMLAHELRNPLAPIPSAIQVLQDFSPADVDLKWARDVIERQVQHLTRLVDDLLDVSRISRGKIILKKEHIKLAHVVADAVEIARPHLEARKHQLTVSQPPEPVWLEADATRLAQILSNLLNNAAKYTEKGGQIWLTVAREGEEAVLRVRDTGVGIAAAMLPHVFELFTQADRSLDRSQGGLGIGLTLVRHLVELHGGQVQACSGGLGQGSEFVVRLPVLSQIREGLGERVKPEPSFVAPPCRRILIADDNEDFAEMTGRLLERKGGHNVKVVFDGPAALAAARAFQPEAAFLDIGLPGINGYDLAQQLRREPGLQDVLLVALTGYGQESDRRRALAAGFDEHLTKPTRFATLQRVLAERARVAMA
jgi:signal transduction histidine kinase/ActR/RegA family two-component response regulator